MKSFAPVLLVMSCLGQQALASGYADPFVGRYRYLPEKSVDCNESVTPERAVEVIAEDRGLYALYEGQEADGPRSFFFILDHFQQPDGEFRVDSCWNDGRAFSYKIKHDGTVFEQESVALTGGVSCLFFRHKTGPITKQLLTVNAGELTYSVTQRNKWDREEKLLRQCSFEVIP